MTQQLTAIGLGPGDPELITVKGVRTIQEADLIFVPRSRDGQNSLALRIADPYIDRTRQTVVALPLPMTRDADELVPAWEAAADAIQAAFARTDSHADSVRGVYLLLGDPLLYGTFIYIWGELTVRHPHIAISIIPGITSFAAAAAASQTALGTTSDRVVILPASYETDATKLQQLLLDFETVILLKVGTVLPQLLTALETLGLLGSTVYAEQVGMPEERIVDDLRQLSKVEAAPYLSLLIVRRNQ